MYLYWIVDTKVPVNKIGSLAEYLSKFSWFGGLRIVDNNFPRGMAAIKFRVKSDSGKTNSEFWDLFLKDTQLHDYFDSIKTYHTPENEDTWRAAHFPKVKHPIKKGPHLNTLARKGVLILGKDSGEYFIELLKIKKYLVNKGYNNATLLRLEEDIPNQSLSQKAKSWGLLCRFTIIVDRAPAGHLSEFEMLKNEETIIAILRPTRYQSTSMMEFNPKTDLIKIFEFKHTPLEIMNDAVIWAEKLTDENVANYKMKYWWRS
jgi:hypothetical protein